MHLHDSVKRFERSGHADLEDSMKRLLCFCQMFD